MCGCNKTSAPNPCAPRGEGSCTSLMAQLIPASGLIAITPDNNLDSMPGGAIARSLWVGTGGVICVQMEDGTLAAPTVPDGAEVHWRVRRVLASIGTATTTATGIFGYR